MNANEGPGARGGRDLYGISSRQTSTRTPPKGRHALSPEPKGYLHIRPCQVICLNFGIAQEFGGRATCRFDDTIHQGGAGVHDAIERDVRWLGLDWGRHSIMLPITSSSYTNGRSTS